MKELINNVSITGDLVKKSFEEFTTKSGDEAIGGSIVLRTADMSEHEIKFFSYKYKKDENGNLTSEERYFYKEYTELNQTLKDLSQCSEGERPDVISITDGMFVDNDFKGNDNKVVESINISAKFINKVEPKDYDSTILQAKFEVEGIIESITDEIVKNVPTGNLVVKINIIGQKADGFGKDAKYEADKLIPVRMTVDKAMAVPFRSAGYYDGCFTKVFGQLINTVEITKTVEQVSFGDPVEKEMRTYNKKFEIKSGMAPSTIFEHELTQEVVDTLKAKRKVKLEEVRSGVAKTNNDLPFKPDTSTPAPATTYNPFAQ